jgi:mannose-6-phosphate isomerase
VLKRHLWGGRRLESLLHKELGPGSDYAESWEIADHGADQSVVAAGPLTGTPLAKLVAEHGPALLGRHHPQPRFPLLFKFLDAHQPLSVQVHPNDEQAARLHPPDYGKTEAWVILAADPGSFIYGGLRRGFDRAALARELDRGTAELCLHRIEPRPGDCYFLPAGTVHALGPGLVVAEIQQSSDTTYRLFDYNRVGPDGKPRQLHLQEGLAVVDERRGPVVAQQPQPAERPHVERLVDCEKFVLDRWRFDQPQPLGGDERFHIAAVLEGRVTVDGDPSAEPLGVGGVVLLPAAVGSTTIRPLEPTVLLDMYLPASHMQSAGTR